MHYRITLGSQDRKKCNGHRYQSKSNRNDKEKKSFSILQKMLNMFFNRSAQIVKYKIPVNITFMLLNVVCLL